MDAARRAPRRARRRPPADGGRTARRRRPARRLLARWLTVHRHGDFDPFGGATLADPYPQFAYFVDQQPVLWSAELGYWVVSRYADARRVPREHETFSAANTLAPVTR